MNMWDRAKCLRHALVEPLLPRPVCTSAVTLNWCRKHDVQITPGFAGLTIIRPPVLMAKWLDQERGPLARLTLDTEGAVCIVNLLANSYHSWTFKVPFDADDKKWVKSAADCMAALVPQVREAFDFLAESIEMEPT